MKLQEGLVDVDFNRIVELYDSVGWSVYTQDLSELQKALENSSFIVLMFEGEKVVGLARSVSDDSSIHYLQDILVDPKYQRLGVGRQLMERCLKRFSHVRTHMILTDDELKQKQFYESLGYRNTKDLKENKLNAFVRMKDISLR